MAHILLTGAAGFIGYHLADKLLREGHRVTGVDNVSTDINHDFKRKRLEKLGQLSEETHRAQAAGAHSKEALPGPFSFLHADISDAACMAELFQKNDFDLIIHLAARTGVRPSLEEPLSYIDSNIKGFCVVLEEAKKAQLRVVFASSSSVYGDERDFPFKEDSPANSPVSLYAVTKKSDEMLAHYYAHTFGMSITGLRFFTVYGPWNRKDMAVYLFLKAISEGRPIQLFNNGLMRRDFTFVGDIVESIFRLATEQNPPSGFFTYNIGNGHPIYLIDLVRNIESNLQKKAIIEYRDIQPGDMVDTWADSSALFERIHFKPQVSLAEGIAKTTSWFLSEE